MDIKNMLQKYNDTEFFGIQKLELETGEITYTITYPFLAENISSKEMDLFIQNNKATMTTQHTSKNPEVKIFKVIL